MTNIVRIGNLNIDIGLKEAEIEILKEATPVRTGNLKKNWTLQADGSIINPTSYGIYVELGTGPFYEGELGPGTGQAWGFPGRFMVRRSIEKLKNSILARVLKSIDLRKLLKLPDEIVINYSGRETGGGGTISG